MSSPRVRPIVTQLESRLFLAAHHPLFNLSGRVFDDLNGDGLREGREHWLAGVAVYLDINGNGSADAGEPQTTTGPSGAFTFHKLTAGTYQVVQTPPPDMMATTPAAAAVDLSRHGATNLKFGDGPTQSNPTPSPTPSPATGDTAGPIGVLNSDPLTTAAGSTFDFTVTYMDATAVSAASISGGNLRVTEPGNAQVTPTLVSLDGSSDGPMRVATYEIPAPGGTWDASDNGNYAVNLLANQVFDSLHNAAAATSLGSLSIAVGETASAKTGAPFLLSGSDTGTFNNDDLTDLNNRSAASALKFSISQTVDGGDVTLFADGKAIGNATAHGSSTTITTDGATALTDGIHLFTARQTTAGAITSGDSATLGIVIDTQPPTASSTPANVTATGGTSYTFTVQYRDNIAVDVGQLGTGDVVVTGPNGFNQKAALVQINSNSSGSPRTATYSITPPGGSWKAGANGTYTIALQAGQVFDIAGNPSPAAVLATFTVGPASGGGTPTPGTPAPGPVVGTTPPTAGGFAGPDVTTSGATTYSFTVTYHDDSLINLATLLGANVIVTPPTGPALTATIVSDSSAADGKSETVTYRITPPGGSWDAADNGTYTVSRTAGLLGLLGKSTEQTLGSFKVNIKPMPAADPPDSPGPKKPGDKNGDGNDPGDES
jgi:hypothetical protein